MIDTINLKKILYEETDNNIKQIKNAAHEGLKNRHSPTDSSQKKDIFQRIFQIKTDSSQKLRLTASGKLTERS